MLEEKNESAVSRPGWTVPPPQIPIDRMARGHRRIVRSRFTSTINSWTAFFCAGSLGFNNILGLLLAVPTFRYAPSKSPTWFFQFGPRLLLQEFLRGALRSRGRASFPRTLGPALRLLSDGIEHGGWRCLPGPDASLIDFKDCLHFRRPVRSLCKVRNPVSLDPGGKIVE